MIASRKVGKELDALCSSSRCGMSAWGRLGMKGVESKASC